MASNSDDLAKEIVVYIKDHSECKILGIQTLELSGKRKDLEVYRLPVRLMRYNVSNGRFAAQYRELKSKLGRDLDPSNRDDVEEIKKLLLQDKTAATILRDDFKRIGQKVPALLTHDGFLVNGNRRMAILSELSAETGDEKWNWLEVSVLPKGVEEKDVWRLEAGLQFSRDERLDYTPINRLLMFRDGTRAGLTPKQIASTLYGGFEPTEIEEDLERLKLIDNYLLFIGQQGHYKYAERFDNHFINLRTFIVRQEKKGTDKLVVQKVVKFCFDLIQNGISHLELRSITDIMDEPNSRASLLREFEKNSAISDIVTPKLKSNPPVKTPLQPKTPDKDAPSIQVFQVSKDIAEAAKEKNKPTLLLKRALTNLESVDTKSVSSSDAKVKELLADIETALRKLKGAVYKN